VRRRARDSLLAMVGWRYGAHALMVALALWNESRPAPSLPDLVVAAVPRVDWIARHNYHLWLAAYLPVALALLVKDRAACLRFLWVGGWLSLLRGVNAGADAATLFHAWRSIVNPLTALFTDAPNVALTKDLFFSGHVASTFLLWLYCRGKGALGPLALAGHLFVVAVVLLAHLHYSIDVVGGWLAAFALFALFERGAAGTASPA
jgi:membrane-associated phospholipid phosphatase